jgi:hypothetical protein
MPAASKVGMDFVPIIFTASGGMGEQFQRQYWNPHWNRVKEEDFSRPADEDRTVGSSCQKEEQEPRPLGRPDSQSRLQTATPA